MRSDRAGIPVVQEGLVGDGAGGRRTIGGHDVMTGAMLIVDDAEIRAQTALGASSIPALRQLQVGRDGDSLVLSGRVATYYFKQLAQEIVRGSARGMTVVNLVDVT